MHLDPGELGQDLRNVLEARPVELDVLAGREVAIAAVILAGDMGERAKLGAGQEAVGDRHPQHRRMLLNVQTVLQAQRPELVLGQLPRQKPTGLVAKLRDAFVDDGLVEWVVAVHPEPPAYEKITGYKPVAIIGKNIES